MATDRMKAALTKKEETQLTRMKRDLDNYVTSLKIEELGLEYAVVSIIGPQSSGKSTLMNHLFGTTFPEKNAIKRRTQSSSLGMSIQRAKDIEPCTHVIDVEEEDGTLLEKQSTLFALAVSDVVLVNMWCKDIGRERGGSSPLLKIVFEKIMNLKSRRKTRLLFVLRDKSKFPLDILAARLYDSIEKKFDSVPKPEAHKNSSLTDFFHIEVTSLPSFEYQEELFCEEVKTLRKRFVNCTSHGGLAGDKTDKVPNSEFSYSLTTIWRSIKENKDLDLPAHKIMVDTVRCDQIVQICYSDFVGYKEWHNLKKSVKSGPIEGFGAKLSSIINTCLSQYDAKVIHCDENVKITKRENLLQRLLTCVQPAREVVLEHQSQKALSAFAQAFGNADLSPGNFLASAKSCIEYSKSIFAQGCKEIEVEHVKLDASEVSERVERVINQYVEHQYVEYVKPKIDNANAVAAVAAAAADAAANKALADKAAADAKIATDNLAAAYAAVEAANDAKAASDAQILVQQAAMAEMIASAAAATAATQAMIAEMKAERASAEQRETDRLLKKKEKKKEESGCTIQ